MPEITLTVRLSPSALDARRGVVRLHPEVLDALGLEPWAGVKLTGARVSAALAAEGDGPPGVVLLDDLTMSNIGVTEGSEVVRVAGRGVARADTDDLRLPAGVRVADAGDRAARVDRQDPDRRGRGVAAAAGPRAAHRVPTRSRYAASCPARSG